MKMLSLLILLSLSATSFSQAIDLSVLQRTEVPGNCNFEQCLNIDEVTERAGKFSFESQDGLLDLFKSRQMIKVRTGQLLPSFNLRISSPIDVFEYIPALIGFIFPSNWFRLKESKLHAKAQEHSYVSLVANQKSMARDMYYASHQEASNLAILNNHADFSGQLGALMKKKYELGEVAGEDLEEILAFSEMLKLESVVQSSLVAVSSSELSYLVNNVEAGEYPGTLQLSLPNLSQFQKLDSKKIIAKILEVSPELKSFTYLIEAARFSKKARSFEFLTPDSGTENAFGFGYLSNRRIGETEIEALKIDKKSFESNIKKAVSIVATRYNSSLEIYQHAISIEKSLNYILKSLISDFEISSKVDINRVASIIKESLSVQQMKNNSIHGYLLAKSQMDRLLFESEIYSSIYATLPMNTKNLDCYLRKENKQIKAAMSRGELSLPEKITFETEEIKFCL